MRQASRYETINAVLGLVLIGLLWAPWAPGWGGWTAYAPLETASDSGVADLFGRTISGWDFSTATAIIVGVFGVVLLAQWVVLHTSESPGVGLAWAVTVEWGGVFVAIWLFVQVLDEATEWGAIAALCTTIGVLIVGWLGFADERVDRAKAPGVPEQPIPAPPAA